jgi:hypothetical protein
MAKNIHGYFFSFLLRFCKEDKEIIIDKLSGMTVLCRSKKLFGQRYIVGVSTMPMTPTGDWVARIIC